MSFFNTTLAYPTISPSLLKIISPDGLYAQINDLQRRRLLLPDTASLSGGASEGSDWIVKYGVTDWSLEAEKLFKQAKSFHSGTTRRKLISEI